MPNRVNQGSARSSPRRSRSPRLKQVRGKYWYRYQQFGGDQDSDYFYPDIDLPDSSQKYCRCVLHVAADQPEWCLAEQFPRTTRKKQTGESETCYNPYAVCTASVGRKGRVECFLNYNLDQVPPRELDAMFYLKARLLRKYNLPETLDGLRKLQKIQRESE